MDGKTIKVGMADLKVGGNGDELTTLGLGSCVGVVIYDSINKIAGMLHAMLPNSEEISNNENRAKFVDTGIDELVAEIIKFGGKKTYFKAKLVGGSKMFKFSSESDILKIGDRNVEAARTKLRELNITIDAEDTGGSFGRTVVFTPKDSELYIRTIGHGEKTI